MGSKTQRQFCCSEHFFERFEAALRAWSAECGSEGAPRQPIWGDRPHIVQLAERDALSGDWTWITLQIVPEEICPLCRRGLVAAHVLRPVPEVARPKA